MRQKSRSLSRESGLCPRIASMTVQTTAWPSFIRGSLFAERQEWCIGQRATAALPCLQALDASHKISDLLTQLCKWQGGRGIVWRSQEDPLMQLCQRNELCLVEIAPAVIRGVNMRSDVRTMHPAPQR